MKKGFYRKLAWTGIKKNKKLYIPFILTCMGTIMMCYIISFLSISPTVGNMPGGSTVQGMLSMGVGVMSVFSVIFLFYTNSFLIRRRKREFGLYNILGLSKKNLAVVLAYETVMMAVMTICGGILLGFLFSKLAELCMIKILGGSAGYSFLIEWSSVKDVVFLFGAIFIVIYLNTLRQIQLTNPIQLLHSESVGEKPPKANWIVAILGAVILGGAYYLSVTIDDPVAALVWFFVAVGMVIVATYMLFIAGSVTLCRILQKNRRYYYKTNHFVSVSSMAYRMKRNGAGLASICILCTMVLVMVSSTVCLYAGAEKNLRNRYPRDINLDTTVNSISMLFGEETDKTREIVKQTAIKNGAEQNNIIDYRTADFGGMVYGNQIVFDSSVYENRFSSVSDIWQFFIVPLSDYNELMGKEETLSEDEVILYVTKEMDYQEDTLQIGEEHTFRVKKHADRFVENGIDSMQIFPTMYIIVSDFNSVVEPLLKYTMGNGEQSLVSFHWFYAFDLNCSQDNQILIQDQITDNLKNLENITENGSYFHVYVEGIAKERAGFYGLYGGLFFLGILLGIVFIFAAVLIIYYKQVSEGYEDRSRFDIMQKVGMTKIEIKKSINSQILTVFFMPLIMAGVHLAFAFPFVRKLLLLFGFTNVPFLIMTTVGCYLIFALFYLIVYWTTSQSYFSIVSGMREDTE